MNELKTAHSLYLQQHQHNPVHWKLWSDAAFDLAKRLDKPVLVSIGYAACHWCHVMERESFEDESIAAYMNEHFVCIKVDREEHPEVDHLYMDALMALNQQGGWPLNMFVTPDRKPFFGGTYFPPQAIYQRMSWRAALEAIVNLWQTDRATVMMQASQLVEHLNQVNTIANLNKNNSAQLEYRKWMQEMQNRADVSNGGFGNAPKFPHSYALTAMLDYAVLFADETVWEHLQLSLDKMLWGGIYDKIEGGWSRYAVDARWHIPHFEKMLYDNAALLALYAKTFNIRPKENWKKALLQTGSYFLEKWRNEEGLFYSSLDADSEGSEGKYYLIKAADLKDWDSPYFSYLLEYFHINPEQETENYQILHAEEGEKEFCERYNLDLRQFEEEQEQWFRFLRELRKHKVAPAKDKKCQLSWNALMSLALSELYAALKDEVWLIEAQSHMEAMLQHFYQDENWFHLVYADQRIPAHANDWSLLIQALLRLAQLSFDAKYLYKAKEILEWGQELFFDNGSQVYFYSQASANIPVRKLALEDHDLPSVQAVMSDNLLKLGIVFKNYEWVSISEHLDKLSLALVGQYPLSVGFSFQNLLKHPEFSCTVIHGIEEKSSIKDLLLKYKSKNYFYPSLEANEGATSSQSIENIEFLTCYKDFCAPIIKGLKAGLEKYC